MKNPNGKEKYYFEITVCLALEAILTRKIFKQKLVNSMTNPGDEFEFLKLDLGIS